MSLRGTKRATGMRGEEAGTSKRRRTEPEDALWQLRPVSDLKMSSIYNRNASEAPAELFRKDLISAMKLPDSEPLTPSEYWIITDTWKQDWERGVQVPVNPDSLPAPKVKIIENPMPPNFQEFKLPKDKYIHLTRDVHYQSDQHLLSSTPAKAEAACTYDLDTTDTAWLKLLNAERARAGAPSVTEDQLEKVIEELEVRTWDKIQAIIKSEEGLGIEYDENVICDVCRSPDSEDGNEMVFCDSCNICVHQACYGITVIPDGQWLCRPCGAGIRPTCVLCPNLGGAMKCTPSGHKWAHVSCVLWIPEVSIGCAEKMEPITKITSIPASRWSLVCVLCRERKGACIQCSVKTCKTAYHVTCAFKHGLEMRAIIEDENADDGVKLRSYCQKHSVNSKKEKCPGSGSEEEEVKRKRRKDMTSEEKTQARAARLQEIEGEFDRHVTVKDISTHLLDIDQDAIHYIYNYWKLKRRAGYNRPLLPPKSDDHELLTHRQEQADLDKMKMFVQLRQDLERVRNLCYMVSRREKLSRTFFRMREQTFHKQIAVLTEDPAISGPDLAAIIEANHGPSIYDRLYSHPNAPDHKNDFDDLLARIAPQDSSDEKKKDRNGLVRGSKTANPYKKHYVNGSRRSGSMYSGYSSEESGGDIGRSSKYRGRAIGSTTDDDSKKPATSPKKKVSPKGKGKKSPKKVERKKRKVPQSKAVVESSSEDDTISSRMKKDRSRSKTLQQMEKEMTAGKTGQSGTDSDDLIPIRTTRNSKFPMDIYSDSSDDVSIKEEIKPGKSGKAKNEKSKSDKAKAGKSSNENDSQQPLPRTKAAMKEFIPAQPEKKTDPIADKPAPKKRGRKPSNKDKKTPVKTKPADEEAKNKENIKLAKQKDNPTDLIVPQRQAAKKAYENIRSTTTVKKEDSSTDKQVSGDDSKSKPKLKAKEKEVKDIPQKVGRKKSSKDQDKELIAYVPQRQAAKKAAAHIKSGLGSKVPVTETVDTEKKKDAEKSDTKPSPKKEETKRSKSPQKESSSSSSNSSSSSYSSSSSSEEEQEKPEIKPTAKAREIKPAPRQPSMFSPPGSRPTVDLPFLDKVSRPLSSTSASSDTDSSKASRFSGSRSPSPKRPRRRRKRKSVSIDASLHKAPDKKLKTSDQGSECRVPSPAFEGEEPSRPSDTRASTRARTRSTTSSGNMPNKFDTRQRKPSKDDSTLASTPNKVSKESSQPIELTIAKRKEDEEIKKENDVSIPAVVTDIDVKTIKPKGRSVSIEEKVKPNATETTPLKRTSPRKSTESKHKIVANRRMSVKDPLIKEIVSPPKESSMPTPKEKNFSRRNSLATDIANVSPVKKVIGSIDPPPVDLIENKPVVQEDDFPVSDKNWLPKAPSPNNHPPPVEKPGDHEKYMTEDKSLDSDCTDKSSIKMIAKIQANLNENTMIKSPKTPMDARTIDPMDVDAISRNIRKRSLIDMEKKFITQDSSHVQGVEISKSAKIPSTTNPFPNRSVFSPNKDTELFEFDNMLAVDDGFNHEEIMKPFTSYPEFYFKEDSKEQGVQETQNLVERLRMQLNTKKAPIESSTQDNKVQEEDDPTTLGIEKSDQDILGTKPAVLHLHDKKDSPNDIQRTNHFSNNSECINTPHDVNSEKEGTIPTHSNDKWVDLSQNESQIEIGDEGKYDITEDVKEPTTVQSINSASEIGDTISLSKQSDDSQSLSVVDHSILSNDQELTQDNHTYDNNNSMIHSDCATISSPYIGHRESKITTRRSSASSTNSEGSVCSQKTDVKSHLNCQSLQGTLIPEIDAYPLPAYSCRVEPTMPLNQYTTYPPDASPFLSSMGTLPLFGAGPCASSQLTLPSPAGIYGSGLPYTASPLIPPLTKPAFPLCAAFTSSSQNIALTTAMIASPIPKQIDSPRDDIDVSGSDKLSIHVVSSPSISIDSYNESSNTRPPTKMSNDSNETIISLTTLDTKSSPKALTKTVSKFSGKSPGKSPGISPRQSDIPKATKRSNNKNNRSQRGRGRSKSRGQGNQSGDFTGNSIQSKLVGTVYDFDEEIANDGVDLKSLRERRKSVDTKDDRKSEHSYKDSSQSPRAVSPHPASKNSITDTKDIKPSTPEPAEEPQSPGKNNSDRGPGFTQVHPVLPGPVDMRTYNPFENPAPPTGDAYHSHLLAFASGTADQQLVDFDEEMEKKLHSALMASKPKPGTPAAVAAQDLVEPPKETFTPHLPKVSLSDSRNQLKVKIKGPFLDANYSASSVQPVVPQPPPPAHDSATSVYNMSNSATSSMTGSTNLRRMRKKELLRQYWTQDMNMDDPTNVSNVGIAPPPSAPQPLLRAVITIPKAVASMTSIPTREDYKIIDTPVEKKKRKIASGLSRELRHLKVSMNDDIDPSDDVKLSSFAGSSSQAHKRRCRVSTKPNQSSTTSPTAPKLKIKFGSNIVPHVNEEPSVFQFRPPKKRLQSIPKPSLEDLKRESMKYRRLVMANFEEDEKANTDKYKPSKTEKRKKKKDKKSGKEKLQVINRESQSATKLIIKKIKCTKEGKGKPVNPQGGTIAAAVAAAPEPPVDPLEFDPTKPDPLAFDSPLSSDCISALRRVRTDKVTPIRLKRSPQGSGYVMEAGANLSQTSASESSAPTASTSAAASLEDNKQRGVR
ncbi:PHD finger protein rhinoceros [Bicyclus anynana]|uniref:PHD finger protein rhinoceros n=1 Tax=Bicyclus anynana TaxID=110368 RepID=A0A6J1N0U5_BICAN|nr:PHD finger protein rhinoceros [Bicyclus anynana]XP_023938672.1 PHD finger protein rhinoceros [Bicyclus anynana]XP_023938673.1 PHD finger protein rhinoceros [Bicyclus anynana]